MFGMILVQKSHVSFMVNTPNSGGLDAVVFDTFENSSDFS